MLKKVSSYILEKDVLSGRQEGATYREALIKRLEIEAPDVVLPIDFSKVKVVDFSFADEFLCRIIRRVLSGDLGEKYIVVESLTESLKENIGMALKERELACIYIKPDSSVEILGKISDELKKTYLAAVDKGKITARDVQEFDSMDNISAASNRLTRLKDLGLLRKTTDEAITGGGRQYVYEPVR
jgi:predicted transcriptional regulator